MATSDRTPAPSPGDAYGALQSKRFRLPGYDTEVGPFSHLQAERERLDALEFTSFRATPVGVTIGAEVEGIDLTAELSETQISELRSALLDFNVLFFRNQPLTAEQHVRLGRRFGDLEVHPFIAANDEHPELVRFEKSADVGGYENGWHSDVSWRATPSMGAILHAVSVPEVGGDTLFCDMAAVYDGLTVAHREQVDPLVAVHDYLRAFGHSVSADQREQMREDYPPVEHPVIRTHPETGRRLVYVNRFFVDSILGLNERDGLDVVDRLCTLASMPEYQCRLRWEPDTVAFWDNRAVQHYACSDYWPHVRVMERASIVGDAPI